MFRVYKGGLPLFFSQLRSKTVVFFVETCEKPSSLGGCGSALQVNVIRTVEVEIENKIKDLKDGAKDESSKQRQFQRKVADLHKEMANLSPDGKNKQCKVSLPHDYIHPALSCHLVHSVT